MSLLKTWKRRILRRFAPKNTNKGVLNKTWKKIATGIAGLGFLATGNMTFGQQSVIQAFDGNSTLVNVDYDNNNNARFHITSQKTSGINAFNSFSDFNLATNETANFYLPNGTSNLINFVKTKIEIDGTVNTIKNNKIGGNLFFLSSQGLVLGSSGVVNCGALYAMTPTTEFMDKFVGGDDGTLNIDTNATEIAQITSRKFVNHNGIVAEDGVPLNADGSIVIAGRINAIDNVGAHAGSVTLEGSGRIDTGITDFSALVNTDNIWQQDATGYFYGQPSLEVSVSGLAMTTNEDGNVELVAIADTKGKTSSSSIVDGVSSHTKATADAKVKVSGKVNAKKNATFEAVAVNGTLAGTETIVEYGENRNVRKFSGADAISSVNAAVEIGTTAQINADNDIALRALATNVYKNSKSPVDLGLMIAGMVSPVNISAETAVTESKASVKVAQGAILSAKKNIVVKASSETDVIVGASTALAKSRQTSGGVAAGVVFAESASDANIEISGSLNAGVSGDSSAGDIMLDAVSVNSLDATAAAKTANDKSAISTGIVIGKISNRSDVKISNTAVINAKKAVKGKALSRSDVSTTAMVETGDDTFAGMAINFTDFDSSANVDIKSSIDAVGNIDLSASNLVLQNRSTAKGTVGHSKLSKAVANLQSSIVAGIFSLSKFTSKFAGPIKDQATKFRAAGAIVINRGTHDAGLDIGNDVRLTSGSDMILKSSSVVQDLFIQADSVARSKTNTADGTKASVSAGIVYSDISQNSTLQIADASYDAINGNKTVLTAKTVDIGSEAKIEYNRVNRMIAAIEDAIATLKVAVSDSAQLAMINSVETAYQTIKNKFSGLGAEDLSKADNISFFIDALTSLTTMSNALSNLISGENLVVAVAAKTVTSAIDFSSYNNFLNTAVSSAVKGANEENTTDIGFAGAVGLTDFNVNSDVLIGRNVTVKSVNPAASVSDAVKVSAKTDTDMISGAGYLIPSSGSKAMGGTYFSQDFNTSAKVMIPEGVNLNGGGKDVAISATNDVKAIAGGFSAAMAGAGIQGMFTHLTGTNDVSIYLDDEADISSVRNLKFNALNNTRIINFAGSVMISSSVGVAAGFAINDFVKDSIVLIGDIDAKYQDYLDRKTGTDQNTTTDSTRNRTGAKIAATGQVDAQAKSKGGFIVAGVAGGITKNDDSGDPGITSKITGKATEAESKLTDTINSVAGKFSNITSELSTKTKTSSSGSHTNPSISLSVAGSGGLNFIETNTRVDISGMTIDLGGTAGANLNAVAVNNTDVMAFAGTAGVMFQTAKKDTSGKSVGIAGAVGLNMLKNKTEAIIKNSNIASADELNVFAVNGGMNIAAGLGLQVSKNSGNAAGAFTMGGSVSLNQIDNTVNAELNGTKVTGASTLKTDINVAAYESDMQITGGVQVTAGQQRGAFGAAVNVSNINNNVAAKISGGTFNQVNNVSVAALQAIAQINGAITAGVVFGTSNTTSIMGAMIYNDTDNNLTAKIEGASINAAGKVAVNAQDYFTGENITGFSQMLNRADSGVSSFISADGGDYYDIDASNEADGSLATPLKDQIKKGSLIVSGAMAISVADTAVGAAVSINDVDNNFTARIDNSTISTDAGTVETNARTDTFMISAAGGVAASTKSGAGGGSVVWNDIDSEVNSGTVNSVITAGNCLSRAANDSRLIGIAGQVTAGKGAAAGLAFTYNKLNSKSNAFSLGAKVNGPGYSVAGSQFLVNAANNGEILNLALTVPVSNVAGIGGAVAINRIDSDAIAIVDSVYTDATGIAKTVSDSHVRGFEKVSATAEEKSGIKAISGSFAFGGQAAVGGAVAYNEITGKTGAHMNNIAVDAKNVLIKSVNDADIWTMASGCGGSGEVAVQGAAATAEISRTVAAGMDNVSASKTDSFVDILAESTGEINSNATVAAVGVGVAGVGAGVVVNRLSDTISSSVSGATLNVKDLEVRAKGSQTIRAFGVAGAGGAYAGVSGSVAVNIINNAVNALIKGNTSVTAEDNIGVVAQSDETLLNYAGIVSGGLVGVGAGLSVNDIQGDTNACIENSTVKAMGKNAGISLKNEISDTAMNDAFIDDTTVNAQYTLEKSRISSTKTGLVVDSSATHTLKSFVANAAAGGGGIAGTVNVSRISGTTGARISNTRINNGATGDVSVNAGDYSNLSGFVGSAGLGGTGVGIAADTGMVNRTTSAKLDGIVSDATSSSTARNVSVKADAKLGISAVDAGLAVGAGGNAIAGTLATNIMQSNTEAIVNNANITLKSLGVNATHKAKTSIAAGAVSASLYGSLGGSLGVNSVKDLVKAEITGSNIIMQSNGSGKFEVQALNDTTLNTVGAAVGGSLVVTGSGNLAVNLIESDVLAHVKNTTMTNRATDVTVKADDKLNIDANLGTVAVGAVGAGASIAVNTLDGKSRAVIDSSILYARDNMNITADTTRNLTQLVGTAAGGAGAFTGNVVYISAGKLLTTGSEDGATNVRNTVTAAENNSFGNINATNDTLTDAEKNSLNAKPGKYSSSAAAKSETSVKVVKNGSNFPKLDCKPAVGTGVVNVKARETTNIDVTGGGAAVGALSAGGSASFIDLHRNVAADVRSAYLYSGNSGQIEALSTGHTNLRMYQGTVGIVGAGTAAYGRVGISGVVNANLSSGVQRCDGDLAVNAIDNASANAESYGLTVGGKYAAGVLATQIDNNSSANVGLTNNNHSSRNFTAKAEKSNNLAAKTVGGAVGIFAAGNGIVSTVNDSGGATLTASGGTYRAGKGKIGLSAVSEPVIVSEAKSAAISGLVSAGISVAKATLSGVTETRVINTPAFESPEITFNATNQGKSNLLAEGLSGGFAATFGYNESNAQNNSTVNVLIGDATYSNPDTLLSLQGLNKVEQKVETRGLTVSGLVASGNNKAKAESNSSTNVSLGGSDVEKAIRKIDVQAQNTSNHEIKADGKGGGLISVDGLAAYAINNITGTVNAAINGKWKIRETLNLLAWQQNVVKIVADSLQAALIGYSGTKAENTITATTKSSFADNTAVTAGDDITFTAINNTVCNQDGANSASGGGYGGIVVNGAWGIANITSTTEAQVGKSVKLLSDGGEIAGKALTRANINNKALTQGAGVVANPLAFSQNTINIKDRVLIGNSSLVKTNKPGQNVKLAASDDLVAVLTADADMQGGFGGVSKAKTTSDITRNNTVDIYGDISSANDVNIYTDASADGETAKYDLTATADSYNKSTVAVAKAELKSDTTQNNTINIYSNADIEALRHINLNSDTGNIVMLEAASEYTWHSGSSTGGYSSTASGERINSLSGENKVTIGGNLLAGKENKVELTIGGTIDIFGEISNSVTTPEITSTKAEYAAGVTTGVMDYANELFERYLKVCELILEYTGTPAADGYSAEKNRLLDEMKKYGLYDPNTGQLVGGLLVQYIALPDMLCTGGDVIINSGSVAGNGKITANGAPQIIVNNNSNLYMKAGDITIVEGGGRLIYNSASLGSNAKSRLSSLSTITLNDAPALISLKENWSGMLNAIIDGKTTSVTPITNLELNGHISNAYGKVQISNSAGDIVMQGRTADTGATINALEVELLAPKGAITQGFSEGIVNIGGNPEDIYKNLTNSYADTIATNQNTTTNQTVTRFPHTPGVIDPDKQTGTWITGGAIYLNASDINVNGLIQSGYSDYKVNLNSGTAINSLIDVYNSSYQGQEITPEMLTAYKLNTAGVKKDASGNWYYEIQAYYNPQTRSVMLEDISPQGGKIYLTGRISSTGNGKIRAFDGSADINLNIDLGAVNQKLPVTLGRVNLGDEAGLVSITDTAKKIKTEFTRNATTVTEYDRYEIKKRTGGSSSKGYSAGWERINLPDIITVKGPEATYQPTPGFYYNWTTGQTISGTNMWKKEVKFKVWGAYTKTKSQLQLEEQKTENLLPDSGTVNRPRLPGTFIGKVGGSTEPYFIKYTKNVDSYSEFYQEWKTFDNAIHSKGTEHYKWGNTQDSSVTYQHALKADHPISIGFIGSTTGGSMQLKSGGSVNLSENVVGKAGSALTITSTKGTIQQTGGKLVSDNFNFNATNGIGSNGAINCQVVSDTGYLNAVSTAGDISIAATRSSGKYGDIKIKKVTAENGNVRLDVYGSIYNNSATSADSLITGRRIDLVSQNGQIGKTNGGWLFIQAGQTPVGSNDTMSASVNATARTNICLNQVSGDMRLGRIESRSGSVDLKVTSGSFDNALPVNTESGKRSTDALIDKWLNLGLIKGDGTNTGETVRLRAVDNYKNSVKAEFDSYMAQKSWYEANPETAETTVYTSLHTKYGSYTTADQYLNAKASDSNSDYYKLLNGTYGWTQNQLLYALQNSIMNRTSGSTDSYNRDANITGRNITLLASNGGIGKDAAAETVSLANLGSNLDTLKKLAATEADDIIWDEANAKAHMNRTTAIGIKMTSNAHYLSATARDNIYLAAATDDPIYVKTINSGDNNIRLLGKNGIFNYNADANAINLTGKDLIIEGGALGTTSAIGAAEKAIVTELSGKLTARAEGLVNIYQRSTNPLLISALYSGGDVRLRATKDLKSVNTGIAFDDAGYLNGAGKLTLISDHGNIGEDGKGIRLLSDTMDSVDATAGGSIFLKAVTNSANKPTMNIGTVTTASTGVFKVDNNAAVINFGGTVNAGTVDITASSIAQNENTSMITAGNFKGTTTAGLVLDSVNNKITRLDIANVTGNILLKNAGTLKLGDIAFSVANSANTLTVSNTDKVIFAGTVDVENIDLNATSAMQEAASVIDTSMLNMVTSDGINLGSTNNMVRKAAISNTRSGNITIATKAGVNLQKISNLATSGTAQFAINSAGTVGLQGDINAKDVKIEGSSINQDEDTGKIVANALMANSAGGLSLASLDNEIGAVSLYGSGNITFNNKGPLNIGLLQNASSRVNHEVQVTNIGSLNLKGTVSGKNVKLTATSITQNKTAKILTENLTVITNEGLTINSNLNEIAKATLTNKNSGNIAICSKTSLELAGVAGASAKSDNSLTVDGGSEVIFGGNVSAANISVTAGSITQNETAGSIITTSLDATANSGISLDSTNNQIRKARLINKLSGNILLKNKSVLELTLMENIGRSASIINAGNLVVGGNIFAKGLSLDCTSLIQNVSTGKIKVGELTVNSINGMSLAAASNEIDRARLVNMTKGNIELRTSSHLDLAAENRSTSAADKLIVNCSGALNAIGALTARNIDLTALTFTAPDRIISDNLRVFTTNGMFLSSLANQIKNATLQNSANGDVILKNSGNLTLLSLDNNSTGKTTIIVENGNIDFSGAVKSKNLEATGVAISQNEETSTITTDNLKVTARNGLSLDSRKNAITAIDFANNDGSTVIKNEKSLNMKGRAGNGSLTIGNKGSITASGNISGNNVSIDLLGDLNSNYSLTATNNLVVNATGKINLQRAQGKNVTLASGIKRSKLLLNAFDMAGINLRLQIDDEQTDEDAGSNVNQIGEAGGINVHDLLAEEEAHGLTEGGDIMLANIGGKRVTLVINHDQGRVNVGQAKLGESMNVTAGGFKGGQFEHTGADDSLKLVFNGVNGKYMNDVTIDKVASRQGVQVSNLDSLTARINADTDIFQLSSVDLLGVGVFSNNQTSVIVPGSENASLEIIIKGESTSITRQAKHLNEPSLADRIASIVDSNTNGLQSSAGATEPSDHSAQKNEIEYSDFIYSGAIPSAITAHGGRVYLTSVDTENDSVVTAETEDENSEMEPNN